MTVLRSPLRPVLRSPLYSPLVGKWGGAFSPSALFQSGDILLWYDPSDLTTMFQDTAGVTPVTTDGQSVAVHLDKGQWGGKTLAQVLAAQTELVTNGAFDTDAAGWTAYNSATLSVVSGKLRTTNGASLSGGAGQAFATVVGRTYALTVELTGTNGFLHIGTSIGNTSILGRTLTASEAIQVKFVATATTTWVTVSNNNTTLGVAKDWDNISAKLIPGYHRTQATGTSMPKYKTDGTLHWLLYDGTDDSTQTPTITWDTDEVAICAGVTKSSDAAAGALAELSVGNTQSFGLFAPGAAAANYMSRVRGTAISDNARTTYTAPNTSVLSFMGKSTTDKNTLRINADEASVATDTGAGSVFNAAPIYFGRRGGTTLPFNGREYQTVIRSRLLSAAELSYLETFVAAKTGVTWGGAFSPSALFQSGDILLWYDPSDLTTMFTNTTDTTQVSADGDSVALMLDKGQWGGKTLAQVLAAQPELVTNGTFDSDTAWTKGTGWTIGSGVATRDATATASNLSVGSFVEVGKLYQIQWTQSGTGFVAAYLGTASGPLLSNNNTPGTYTRLAVATQTGGVLFRGNTAIESIDNVSVKEIPGYHRTQATGTSMPKYKTDGTLHWLLYDGSDDGNSTPSINWGTDEVAICAGLTKSSDAAIGVFAELGDATGNFGLYSPITASSNVAFRSRGTVISDAVATGIVSPVTAVLTGRGKISTDLATLRLNGSQAASSSSDQGTGVFGNYPLYFGRRTGASLPFNGKEYQTVIRSRLLSAAELSSLETFIAAKTGVIL